MAGFSTIAALTLLAGVASAGSLSDIKHVVLFMQENRAFDHYFGTMAGVRGFQDPNVFINPSTNRSAFYQDVDASLSTATDTLLPWYLNAAGGSFPNATQCMVAGDNGFTDNHAALNDDLNNKWAMNNTPWSWGHFTRKELPVHFAIAEGWTVGDMYQESVIASTNPNRVSWVSGSINVPGGPQTPSEGGVYIDNNEVPGCEGPHLNCYPLKWQTFPEYLLSANVTWQVYQDRDNFDDNPLAWFKTFQKAASGSELHKRGMSYVGLDQFYSDCKTGSLPAISYIVGPAELSEHPPYQPKDGAWLQRQVVEALVSSKSYQDTALFISYDETGGFGDHVVPYHSPSGTAGEWMQDPYGDFGSIYSGPGFRLPFYIISPWTRGGNVYTAHSDHISQIKFLEAWLEANGKNVTTTQIPAWRRHHMSNLVQAFDFSKKDMSLPTIPVAEAPSKASSGQYNGVATCEAKYPTTRPPVPFGKQSAGTSLVTENGFKVVRGQLTEGRYLTMEMGGYALANAGSGKLVTSKASATHNAKSQRFYVVSQATGTNRFKIVSALDGSYLTSGLSLQKSANGAQVFLIKDLGNGKGYALQAGSSSGQYVSISSTGQVSLVSKPVGLSLFSVTYSG